MKGVTLKKTYRIFPPWFVYTLSLICTIGSCALVVDGAEFTIPPGTRTDCGQGFTSYVLRSDIDCSKIDLGSPHAIECGKLRYGKEFPRSSGNKCQQSEAEGASYECFQLTYGRVATWQDRLDLALTVSPWLAKEVFRPCCVNGGVCSPEGATLVKRDTEVIPQMVSGRLKYIRADQLPCGLLQGWNEFWNWSQWWRNEAPHCGASVPPINLCGNGLCVAPETCSTCEVDCGKCPTPPIVNPPVMTVRCDEFRLGLNSTGKYVTLRIEIVNGKAVTICE